MINSERNIFVNETEVKPNRYSMLVMIVAVIGIAFCWIINEIGIFRVGVDEMRIGSAVPAIAVLVPLIAMQINNSLLSNPKTKYYVLLAASIVTASVNTLLTFHTTIMLLFPMFMAMLYRSKKLGICALAASLICTTITPVLGYLLGTWDVPLFQELILIATNIFPEIGEWSSAPNLVGVGKILLYIVMPRYVMIGSCALLMFHVIRLGDEHVKNQIAIATLNRRDMLTGLYNQNFYKEVLSMSKPDEQVGILFFDVNGLKAANDSYGHEYGDLLLKRSAQSILDICDQDNISAFRIGGDEFLMIIEGANEAETQQKLAQWEVSIQNINNQNKEQYGGLYCSVAVGTVIGQFNSLEMLVGRADTMMYQNKQQMDKSR